MKNLKLRWDAKTTTLSVSGPLVVQQIAAAVKAFDRLKRGKSSITAIDLTQVTALDTSGAVLVLEWAQGQATVHCANEAQQSTLAMVEGLETAQLPAEEKTSGLAAHVIALGKWASFMRQESREITTFFGKSLVLTARALSNPKRLRLPEIARHIEQVGIKALPIIGLIAFLIAIVLAYQSVAQLRPYGAEQFTVDLIALSIFREMGVLLTAIMVAGRSGSAFTAEIGVMKAREEVDALQVMGFDPFDMLVLPRLIAITIALPLLTFFADILGLIGGYLITQPLMDMTLDRYLERVHTALNVRHMMAGLIKAPVFAFCIGIVGCMHGLRVSGSAESIGRETTTAVVKSIFLVLVLDAFFSILFQRIGL